MTLAVVIAWVAMSLKTIHIWKICPSESTLLVNLTHKSWHNTIAVYLFLDFFLLSVYGNWIFTNICILGISDIYIILIIFKLLQMSIYTNVIYTRNSNVTLILLGGACNAKMIMIFCRRNMLSFFLYNVWLADERNLIYELIITFIL